MKVVFHLSRPDPENHAHALANVENLLADESVETDAVALAASGRSSDRGPRGRSDLALVATGDGVRALLADAPHADRVAALVDRGVDVVACGNAMASRDLAEDDLRTGVERAPSGVGALARRQAEGYGYIKVP